MFCLRKTLSLSFNFRFKKINKHYPCNKIANTMLIANPIYDSVFKYLLEDIEIAKELLSTILGEEIIGLDVRPQEQTIKGATTAVTVYRVDFNAIIRMKGGASKKVLIELQKGKHPADIKRFRKYLGQNYVKPDYPIGHDGMSQPGVALPIITIYFLGFELDFVKIPVLSVDCHYHNAATGEPLDPAIKERFVELLTHNSKVIQIPLLKSHLRSRLERVLQVFNQDYKTNNEHELNFLSDEDDPLLKKIALRLHRGILDEGL